MAGKRRTRYPIGSVVAGDLNTRSLVLAFITELDFQKPLKRPERRVMAGIDRRIHGLPTITVRECPHTADRCATNHRRGCLNCCGCPDCCGKRRVEYFASISAKEDKEWLAEALNRRAGPFMFFGPNPSDPTNYGYWLPKNWEEDLKDVYGVKVNNLGDFLAENPNFLGYIAEVNCHGNITLYYRQQLNRYTRCTIEWSIT